MATKAAFIGLGVMGFHMAGHLSNAGYELRVYNRTKSKAEQWCSKFQGHMAATPAEAAANADFVFCCVGRDDDLRNVTTGDQGAFGAMQTGAIFIDHTTTSATIARELSLVAQDKGIGFLDAPVSGGEGGAKQGVLTVMVGGSQEHFDRAQPVIESFAKTVKLMGPSGAGQLTKMVNQICIAGIVEGLAEGLHFAEQAGLDGKDVVDVISKGAAQSWQMENRHETMLRGEFDFGFAVDWMRKDLGICMEEAQQNGAHLPLTVLVDLFYGDVQSMGGARWDTSSLIARLRAATVP